MLVLPMTNLMAENHIIISGHPDYPPFMRKQGNSIVGVGVDLAKIALNELKVPMEVRYTGPWKRVQKNARHGRIDLIIGIYSNDDRRKYLDYTDAYTSNPTTIFTLKGNEFPYSQWDDLIGRRGTTMLGDSFGQDLDQFILDNLQIDRVFEVKENFERLNQGRADYFLWGYYPVLISARKLGYEKRITAVTRSIVDEHLYMAFSKKSDYKKLIPQINRIIERLKKDGTVKRLIAKHMEGAEISK